MSFTHPQGTRGGRSPRGPVLRWVNRLVARRAAKSDRPTMGMDVLVLHTVGRQSGQPRQTPVAWFAGPEGSRYVVASANGAKSNPAWYHNLAAHPDQVRIELNGERVDVEPEEIHGEERATVWETIVAAAPNFAKYQQKTDRHIPVVRLTPR